jgi:hypothetical protein
VEEGMTLEGAVASAAAFCDGENIMVVIFVCPP